MTRGSAGYALACFLDFSRHQTLDAGYIHIYILWTRDTATPNTKRHNQTPNAVHQTPDSVNTSHQTPSAKSPDRLPGLLPTASQGDPDTPTSSSPTPTSSSSSKLFALASSQARSSAPSWSSCTSCTCCSRRRYALSSRDCEWSSILPARKAPCTFLSLGYLVTMTVLPWSCTPQRPQPFHYQALTITITRLD